MTFNVFSCLRDASPIFSSEYVGEAIAYAQNVFPTSGVSRIWVLDEVHDVWAYVDADGVAKF